MVIGASWKHMRGVAVRYAQLQPLPSGEPVEEPITGFTEPRLVTLFNGFQQSWSLGCGHGRNPRRRASLLYAAALHASRISQPVRNVLYHTLREDRESMLELTVEAEALLKQTPAPPTLSTAGSSSMNLLSGAGSGSATHGYSSTSSGVEHGSGSDIGDTFTSAASPTWRAPAAPQSSLSARGHTDSVASSVDEGTSTEVYLSSTEEEVSTVTPASCGNQASSTDCRMRFKIPENWLEAQAAHPGTAFLMVTAVGGDKYRVLPPPGAKPGAVHEVQLPDMRGREPSASDTISYQRFNVNREKKGL